MARRTAREAGIMGMLDGKVVFVTGGAAGQGRAHVLRSAAEGASVVSADLHAVDAEANTTLIAEAEALGGRVLATQANVSDQAQLDAAVAAGVAEFGRIDAAIVNAGIYRGKPILDIDEAEWNLVLDVNLTGAMRTIKAVAPTMATVGGGSIVIIASVDGMHPIAGSSGYAASKAAAISLAKNAAIELGHVGIRVNAIAPGYVDTDMLNSQSFYDKLAGGEGLGTRQHLLDYGATKTALRGTSVIAPEEVAKVAVFLNSEYASVVTGTAIPVDAGHLLLPLKKLG